jgi:predicted deacylase
MARKPFEIAGERIAAGRRETVDIPAARLYTHTEMPMPVHVVHGRSEGPVLFVSAAIHGDEIGGVEIIRRLLARRGLENIKGTLLAVPVVNVFGFIGHSRYLPDRRDLNRMFPGSGKGSMASRLADLFMSEVVARSTHGIDIHSGTSHRANLPQIRAALDNPENKRLAMAFGAPVVLNSDLRDGSLRQAAAEQDLPMLLYEAGEALRFDETAIKAGVRGVVRVMRALKMLPKGKKEPAVQPALATGSQWVRAPHSGILVQGKRLGAKVRKGENLGYITDPFGDVEEPVKATVSGIVIGKQRLSLVYEGDALFHVATFEDTPGAIETLEQFQEEYVPGQP